ncbi:MAG: HRDC domain-containing protein [Bdellovibrionales bacterium]|nr:HRDC domain-containing protein [Bdellovibrionales bacterium]
MLNFNLIIGIIIGGVILEHYYSLQFYFWLTPALVIFLLFFILRKASWKSKKREKYINERGYVVLIKFNELEHRYIAKNIIGRNLYKNDIVHHINGIKTDNKLNNLCLMDREKHEHFHSWLLWNKKKKGKYPTIPQQKKVLEAEYNGVLLEKITNSKNEIVEKKKEVSEVLLTSKSSTYCVRKNKTSKKYFIEFDEETLISPEGKEIEADDDRFYEPEDVDESFLTQKQIDIFKSKMNEVDASLMREKNSFEIQKSLFNELRKERKKIAKEIGVPVYMIFDNKTLMEMAKEMPVSREMMIQIYGVGPYKLDLYGSNFIEIIKQFKRELDKPTSENKDTA